MYTPQVALLRLRLDLRLCRPLAAHECSLYGSTSQTSVLNDSEILVVA